MGLLVNARLTRLALNEVRGFVLATPVVDVPGGGLTAIWLSISSLPGIALTVVGRLFVARKLKLVRPGKLSRNPIFLLELDFRVLNGRRSPRMTLLARRRMRLSGGTELAYVTAGHPSNPALLLLHGFPGSADYFRALVPELSRVAHVIAPDLPGYGESDVLPESSFDAFGQAISELLNELSVGPRYIYVHDFGAPPAFHIAMRAPEKVLGLIIQNANAHQTGLGPEWKPVKDYWSHPNPENEAAAMAHLTFEGVRNGYIRGMPPEVAARISAAETWEEDWRVMQLPGRMETQRALVRDYRNYVARFDEIADYLERWHPPAVMLWARHDPFFALDEVLSWMQDLPRMEAHILDAGHKLLETHAEPALALILEFINRTQGKAAQLASDAKTRSPELA